MILLCVGEAVQQPGREEGKDGRERDGVGEKEMRIMKDSRDIGNIC